MTDKSRAEYTWLDATYDLALTTQFTIHTVTPLVFALQHRAWIHPHDAVRIVKELTAHLKFPMTHAEVNQFTETLMLLYAEMKQAQEREAKLQAERKAERMKDDSI